MTSVAGDGPDLARELEDVREQQRAISGVLRAVARSAGLEPVLEEVAEACRRLCDADHGSLWLLEGGLLHVGAHQGGRAGSTIASMRIRSTGRRRRGVRPSSEGRSRSRTSWRTLNTPMPGRGSSG